MGGLLRAAALLRLAVVFLLTAQVDANAEILADVPDEDGAEMPHEGHPDHGAPDEGHEEQMPDDMIVRDFLNGIENDSNRIK